MFLLFVVCVRVVVYQCLLCLCAFCDTYVLLVVSCFFYVLVCCFVV